MGSAKKRMCPYHGTSDEAKIDRRRAKSKGGSDIVNLPFHLVPAAQMMCLQLTIGEVYWALVRKRNDKRISNTAFRRASLALRSEVLDNPNFAKLPVDEDLLIRSLDFIERYAINSVDALILCTALSVSELLDADDRLIFASADERLLKADESEGLEIFNPERITSDEARKMLA